MEADITGTLFNDRGAFFASLPPQTPFELKVQFDSEAPDWNPDPLVGDYFSSLPLTLDFGDYHFSTDETRVTVIFDPVDLNCQFLFWSGEAFTQTFKDGRSFTVDEYGIYVQFNTRGMGLAVNDSLDNVRTYDITDLRSTERMYVTDADYNLGAGNRLLSDEFNGITSLAIQSAPEPSSILLAISGAAFILNSRKRNTNKYQP